MKILFITSSLPFGNQEAFVIPEISEIKNKGHEITVIPKNPKGEVLHEDAKQLVPFTVRKSLLSFGIILHAFAMLFRHPLKTLKAFGWMLQSRSLKILLKNLAAFPKALWVAHVAKKWGANHIHSYWASANATIALVASEISGIHWSLTSYRWDIAENNLLKRKSMSAKFIRVADKCGMEEFNQYTIPENQAIVIYSGVPIAEKPSREFEKKSELKIIVPGNLIEKKGHTYLIQAVSDLKKKDVNVSVDLAGGGILQEDLERQIDDLEVSDNFTFLGPVSHSKLMEDMQSGRWDICVLPSIVTEKGEKEGIPISLIEALSFGLPTISTNTGGIAELFEGGAGYLIEEKDSEALAGAIHNLYKDPELQKQYSEAGYKRVQEYFSLNSIANKLLSLFK